ncbi:MAG: hypothetical protein KF900_04045 [Bacteroidetes bacterium]|nr:hypothetical protein [Bacteroidota bacterium]
MTFEQLNSLIETSVKGLNLDLAACLGEKKGEWNVKIKDSTAYIDAFNFEVKPEKYYFKVMSPLFKVPEINKSEIETDLLEFAYSLRGCRICKKGEWYFVMTLRNADDLVQREVDTIIGNIAYYSIYVYGLLEFKYPKAFEEKK